MIRKIGPIKVHVKWVIDKTLSMTITNIPLLLHNKPMNNRQR